MTGNFSAVELISMFGMKQTIAIRSKLSVKKFQEFFIFSMFSFADCPFARFNVLYYSFRSFHRWISKDSMMEMECSSICNFQMIFIRLTRDKENSRFFSKWKIWWKRLTVSLPTIYWTIFANKINMYGFCTKNWPNDHFSKASLKSKYQKIKREKLFL